MRKKWRYALLAGMAMAVFTTGCSTSLDQASKQAVQTESTPAALPVATINGEAITHEDMDFYAVINRIEIAIRQEQDIAKVQEAEREQVLKIWEAREQEALHPNSLLTQIVRLRAMALLGKEKGYTATQEDVEKAVQQVKESYAASHGIQSLIQEYGEDKFWDKQKGQYQMILVVNKVQQDVIAQVKKANPKATAQEINVLAQKQYEDLLVSQVGSLQIKINAGKS